eukprot:gene41829-55483_t
MPTMRQTPYRPPASVVSQRQAEGGTAGRNCAVPPLPRPGRYEDWLRPRRSVGRDQARAVRGAGPGWTWRLSEIWPADGLRQEVREIKRRFGKSALEICAWSRHRGETFKEPPP